jgi:hypothetical protein
LEGEVSVELSYVFGDLGETDDEDGEPEDEFT